MSRLYTLSFLRITTPYPYPMSLSSRDAGQYLDLCVALLDQFLGSLQVALQATSRSLQLGTAGLLLLEAVAQRAALLLLLTLVTTQRAQLILWQ